MRIMYRSISMLVAACFLSASLHAQTGTFTCSSDDGSYHYCRADTQNHVQLIRQLSGSACQQDYSWGFDYRGVWVDRGCRAEFTYGAAHSNNGGAGTPVAAGILGAIILGAAAAHANSNDNSNDQAAQQGDYYRDGYRMGQRDWDSDRPPYYLAYRNRFPPQYERSFAAGYDDGYNNRTHANYGPPHGYDNPYSSPGHPDPRYQDPRYSSPGHPDPGPGMHGYVPPYGANRGTINNPGHGVSGVEEKVITCSDDGGGRYCPAITAGGVDLVHQRSGSPCTQSYSWGVDTNGIWVKHGCRADFVLHGVAAY